MNFTLSNLRAKRATFYINMYFYFKIHIFVNVVIFTRILHYEIEWGSKIIQFLIKKNLQEKQTRMAK